jgi:predicted transposase/invertase (TIGR01784 family)
MLYELNVISVFQIVKEDKMNKKEVNEDIKPSNDYVFKYIFANEKDKKALIGIVESILEMQEGEIQDIYILNPEMTISSINEKAGILDIKAITNSKQYIDIEMQIVSEKDFIKRFIYYNSKMLVEQVKKGDEYERINKTISIIITDFTLLGEEEYFHNKYQLMNIKTSRPLTDLVEYNIVELTKLGRVDMKKISEGEKRKIAWCEFLASDSLEDAVAVSKKYNYAGLASAGDWMIKLTKDDKARMEAEDRAKWAHVKKNQIKLAKEIGFEEGMGQGRTEGITEGIKENTLQVAAKLKQAKAGIDMIVEVTGLSKAEIARL